MTMSNHTPTRALISVSDKRHVETLARRLAALGYQILSTGGTARLLREHQVPVTDVADITGFPEIMDGRIKTLHPKIHGGILGRRGIDDAVMTKHGIGAIDLVVVNLYPFEQTISQADVTRATAIEQIDIGGPAMVRAAAKNHEHVAVVVNPGDYDRVATALEQGTLDAALRRELAASAFAHTAGYDAAIAQWMAADLKQALPERLTLGWRRADALRYGENPHQAAALYRGNHAPGTLAHAELAQGKPLSYNNLADADAALGCVRELERPGCVIVKHANPCGAAEADGLLAAYDRAFACDPTSAFGGIIAFNRPLDGATAAAILERQFVEVIVAPDCDPAAAEALATRPNIRFLKLGSAAAATATLSLRSIDGGLLVQDVDLGHLDRSALKVVTKRQPDERELTDLLFAWRICKHVKSNAIVLARDAATVGIGAGQMSRVMSVRIAAWKQDERDPPGPAPVLASDAFFPFRDGLDEAARCGATAVIQPGGSRRDDEVIAAADEHDMAMVFTGMRHFRH